MSWGIPVVCTNLYALPEIVEDGVDGFLFPVDSVKVMKQLLEALIEDESLRRAAGAKGREKVRARFSPAEIGGRLGRFYAVQLGWA
jgi:glycosyltransferase involved in cell wall biosynthesis